MYMAMYLHATFKHQVLVTYGASIFSFMVAVLVITIAARCMEAFTAGAAL